MFHSYFNILPQDNQNLLILTLIITQLFIGIIYKTLQFTSSYDTTSNTKRKILADLRVNGSPKLPVNINYRSER